MSLLLIVMMMVAAYPSIGARVPVARAATARTVPWLQNGSFESTTTNWTTYNTRVDLGVTSLGGCVSVDTVDYAGIWTRSLDYGTRPTWNAALGAKPTNDNVTGDWPSFTVSNVASIPATASTPEIAPAAGTSLVKLALASGNGTTAYHVAHGPAIVSDTFRGVAGQVVTLNWFGLIVPLGDDFAVLGYLLDTDYDNDGVASGTAADCHQYEILDQTGTTVSSWQYASVSIPATKDFYKFVFVGGTFDKTGYKGSGASFYIDNISQGTPQTVSFSLAAITANFAAGAVTEPFTISATSTSGLPVTYTSLTPSTCTVSGSTLTVVGAGTCTISATQSGADSGGTLWAASPSVTSSFTITANAATATSTVAPTNTSSPTPAFTATSTPTATNTPTSTSAPTSTKTPTSTFTATATPSGQYVTFATPADRAEDASDFTLAATSNVGLPVRYTSTTPAVCTVTSSGTVHVVGFGTCSITASAPAGTVGGVTYAAAPDVTRTFVIKKKQTVTFAALGDKVYNAADFTLSATASSTLPVTYTSSTPAVCTVTSGGTVHLVAPGTCTIAAAQAGGVDGGVTYAAAPAVTQSFTVNPAGQVISFPTVPESHIYQGGIDLAGTSSAGLEITYTSMTPTICTVVGNKVRFIGVGKCTIKASQLGGTVGGVTYGPSPDVFRDFFVTNYTPTATITLTSTRTYTPTKTPSPIPFLMKKGAVGASFVLGLLQNGTLVTWGMNREYQANIPPCCGSSITDVAVGTNFALALKGGAVYGWGANTKGQLKFPSQTKKSIVAIAAGGAHGLALTAKGVVYGWGDNAYKQASVPKGVKDVVGISGGAIHSLSVTKKGTVIAWGGNTNGQTSMPPTLKDVVMVAAGLDHSLALKKDGTVVAWGGNAYGQSSVPTNATGMKQVSAGNQFSLAVKNDGTVFGWGRNENNVYTVPAEYTDIYTVAAGYANTILGLRNGRIIVLGDQSNDVGVSRTPTKTATPTP